MKYAFIILALVAAPLLATAGHAHRSCHQCGCQRVCKVCKLVPDVKKVPKIVYDVECEDFCVPGPSKKCGVRCVPDCDALHGCRKEIVWQPCCGKVYTRKKLVKKTIIEEKPGFKCVVVVLCKGCGNGCECGEADEAQTQALIEEATARGILPVSATEEVTFTISDDGVNADVQPAVNSSDRVATSAVRVIGAVE